MSREPLQAVAMRHVAGTEADNSGKAVPAADGPCSGPQPLSLQYARRMPWWRRIWTAWRHGLVSVRYTRTGQYIQQLVSHGRDPWPQSSPARIFQAIMSIRSEDRYHSKQGRSTCRIGLGDTVSPGPAVAPRAVFLKRFHRAACWRRLLALLSSSSAKTPACHEWKHLLWAKRAGITVPEPLACGEQSGPGLSVSGFLMVAALDEHTPVHEALPLYYAGWPSQEFVRWKRRVIAAMARIVQRLHRCRRFHRDLYLCHFFVPNRTTWHAQDVALIDLHRLTYRSWCTARARTKDLAQLLFSSYLPGVTCMDRWRFLYQYLYPERLKQHRRLIRAIVRKAGIYEAKAVRRRARNKAVLGKETPQSME
ncbi:MAG: hypothetical protein C4297_04040 [Gemmataceae bacterium]